MKLTAAQLGSAYLNLQHVDGAVTAVELQLEGDVLIVDYFTADGPALRVIAEPDGTTSRQLTV